MGCASARALSALCGRESGVCGREKTEVSLFVWEWCRARRTLFCVLCISSLCGLFYMSNVVATARGRLAPSPRARHARCTKCRHEKKIRARHASNTADCSRGGLVAAGEPLALRKREERSTRYPAACRPSPLVGESQHRGRWIWPLEPRQRLAARIPKRRAFAPAAARPPLSDGAGALHAGALGLGRRRRRRLLEEVREVPLLLLALGGARGDGGVGRARANGVAPPGSGCQHA